MTKDEIQTNTEIRIPKPSSHHRAWFDIRASDFFCHSSFVIRYLKTITVGWDHLPLTRFTFGRPARPASSAQIPFAFRAIRQYLIPVMFDAIKAQLTSAGEKLAALRRFL